MILHILRHSAAEDAGPGGDEARQLTPRGRERARAAANGMRALGLKFEAILTSPLARAAQTAEQVAAAFANDPAPQVLPALSPGASVGDAVAALGPFARQESILVVGHEPQLSDLVALLLTGSANDLHLRLKKGACVALELPNKIDRGSGELRWMMTQRQLRKFRK